MVQIKQLVSAARTMISMQVGLSVGALRVVGMLRELGEPYETRHGVFAEFMMAIPADIPVGTARLYWTPQALLDRDAVLAAIEARFRKRLLEECFEIIRMYKPEQPATTPEPPSVFSAV
ncbi:MAG: hypothetical protein V4633_08540 [Pseudomonadota bacterium]